MSGSGSNPFFELNAGTVIWSGDLSLVPRWTMRDQFEEHYDEIRAIATAPGAPGYSVLAVYTDGVVCAGHLAAVEPGEPGGVLVIGRHTSAQMCLARDPTIALRHLAVRVSNVGGEPEARLIDLNTGQGFHIEGAGPFQGARISGPAFVRIGSYGIMLFPRGDVPEIWPAHADGVFERLVGARVVEPDEERAGTVTGYSAGSGNGFRRDTIITRVGPPVAPKRQRRKGILPADTVAVLTARQDHGQTLYPLNAHHLERGVLLGRYDRCEVELHGLLINESASRVHLLLLQDGDRFLAIDTASSNGTWLDGETVSVAALPDEAVLELAPGNVVHWRTIGSSPRREYRPAEPSAPKDPPPQDDGAPAEWKPVVMAQQDDDDTLPPNEEPLDWDAVVAGGSAWEPGARSAANDDDEDLPSALDVLADPEPPSWVSSPLPALIIGLLGVILILGIAIAATGPDKEPEPRQCIHPIRDLGTDSPGLRLFLQHQDPDICFQYRWSPWVQELLDNHEAPAPEPDWLP